MNGIDLEMIKNMNIMEIDPSVLADGQNIKIDIIMPKEERILNFITQMKGNPYFYRHGERVVKVSFADTDLTFDEIYENILTNK